jgi:hypothetical protein
VSERSKSDLSPHGPAEEHRAFIRRSSRAILRDWLLHGFKTEDFTPVHIAPTPHAATQISGLYERVPDSQEKLKGALIDAVSEWRAADGGKLLRDLSYLAAQIRPVDVVTILEDHLSRLLAGDVPPSMTAKDRMETVIRLGSVIAGFAPHPEAEAILRRLYSRNDAAPTLGAVLFIGLCRARRGSVAKHLPRFIEIAECNPGHFDEEQVVRELLRVAGPRAVADAVAEADLEPAQWLLNQLARLSKLEFDVDSETGRATMVNIVGTSGERHPILGHGRSTWAVVALTRFVQSEAAPTFRAATAGRS